MKFKGELITTKLIKVNYLGEGENSKTLQNLLEYHNNKTQKTLAKDTLRNFGVTEGYISRYLNSTLNTSDIYLKNLNYRFINEFIHFLQTY